MATKARKCFFRTKYNNIAYIPTIKDYGKSMTKVGETYTIKELMLRAAASGQILNSEDGLYIDASIEQINEFYKPAMDLTDYDRLQSHINSLQTKIETQKQLTNQNKLTLEASQKKEKLRAEINAEQNQAKAETTIVQD